MDSFKTIEQSQVTISELMLPSHTNFSGKIHGGYILSLMDQIAFACASKHSSNYCVTASVDTVDFLRHCNSSYFTMVAKDKNGDSVPVPGLILQNEKQMRRFLKSLNRQELKKKHRKESSAKHEINNEDLEILKNSHKVQLKY